MAAISTWISSHGSGGILAPDSPFKITTQQEWPTIQPRQANNLFGFVLFPLPGPLKNVSRLKKIKIEFSSHSATIEETKILSGNHTLVRETELMRTGSFILDIDVPSNKLEEGKGIALSVGVNFQDVRGSIKFISVGVEADIVPLGLKFDTGTWNVTDVRPWDKPQTRTQGDIKFSTEFSFKPMVIVSMCGADIGGGGNFRVRVTATDIDLRGFVVHADTWSDTVIYSCAVSWIAVGY